MYKEMRKRIAEITALQDEIQEKIRKLTLVATTFGADAAKNRIVGGEKEQKYSGENYGKKKTKTK